MRPRPEELSLLASPASRRNAEWPCHVCLIGIVSSVMCLSTGKRATCAAWLANTLFVLQRFDTWRGRSQLAARIFSPRSARALTKALQGSARPSCTDREGDVMAAACANRPASVAKGSNQLFAWPGRGPLAQPRVCGASTRPLGRRRRPSPPPPRPRGVRCPRKGVNPSP